MSIPNLIIYTNLHYSQGGVEIFEKYVNYQNDNHVVYS